MTSSKRSRWPGHDDQAGDLGVGRPDPRQQIAAQAVPQDIDPGGVYAFRLAEQIHCRQGIVCGLSLGVSL